MKAKPLALVLAVLLSMALAAVACNDGKEEPAPDTQPTTAPTEEARTMPVTVYFANTEQNPNMEDCSLVFPTERQVPTTDTVAEATLTELFRGPNDAEASEGFRSFFSSETDGVLIGLKIEGDTAYVNLADIRGIISGANSSCGSAEFFAEVEQTLADAASVRRVIFAIDGDPATFYEWMPIGCGESNDNCDPTPFQ
ncbi:MAG: GerMN domain-containing protein [Dehalococcoidia bacterium]